MELKNYQKAVIRNLSSYLDSVNTENNVIAAWKSYWLGQDINVGFGGVPTYNNVIDGVPHICTKVPTGGGKTFIACAAVKPIFNAMPLDKPRVVVWLVPSDSILTQTIETLSNAAHPYRQKLDAYFAGRVGVYTKDMLLNGQNFSPDTVRDMLTICVLSYGSLRIDSKKKDVRKVYQENGNLLRFAEYFKDDSVLLADTPDTALIQVLRHLSPITIVDESHNAGSDLSVEMLNNLNPSLVLDLTATPRKNSNIISYVDARELKKENMVKLPVVVYNRNTRQSVIQDAIQFQGSIEKQAIEQEKAGGEYIRPIVLFQAQPKTSEDSETFDKIKSTLVEMGIPKEQIAIKTSKIDDIGKTNLMSRDCPIRFIITVNALKEGWDCPFAYILASLANKTSTVDVEQILGRILRQPYAKQHSRPLLNTSYVFTCSKDFHATLENIVSGLNKAGFSRKDFRLGEDTLQEASPADEPIDQQLDIEAPAPSEMEDTFEDIVPSEVKAALEAGNDDTASEISKMVSAATQQAAEYNEAISGTDDIGFVGGELGDMLNQNVMQHQFAKEASKLRVPQFFLKTVPDLFGDEFELLEPDNLSDGFSLSGQDSQVNLELATGEMYRVDIQEHGEAIPKYKRASKEESEYIRNQLAKLPQEKKITRCIDLICDQINNNNRYATAEITEYVRRIVSDMTDEKIYAMETAIPTYALKIQKKIETLEEVYREKQFDKWLDSGKIVCRESYGLPKVITPALTIDSIPYSLYEAEKDDLNKFEKSVIDVVVSYDNIEWWHRIIERKGMRLNGFINHYPDFMVMTKSGKIVLIEAKGDYLDGDDSKTKLKLGRQWQAQAGANFRYFMVFKDKELGLDGAYTLDKFAEVMKDL
ncbi:DEAD/DEAH box helicase [Breznakiella homolactica]|uniref:DEAD/DEAH box helicase family protein n=1 Tax=Breznakiella homolactica TaxID=2798577 RepID=A0A7T8B9V2_9SPIR|nr:DEAD/DEAH box helicase family protein [Breznakiella homolactica]QQO07578.1 DEAD/DEAH box helicase family protein [Breznakiella homolactica]